MSHISDPIVSYPVAQTNTTFLRIVNQCSSASFRALYHPGGTMTGSLLALPQNFDRKQFLILNSSSFPMAMGYGSQINSQQYMAKIVAGVATFNGNNITRCNYTGPIWIRWDGDHSLSGSAAFITEFSY